MLSIFRYRIQHFQFLQLVLEDLRLLRCRNVAKISTLTKVTSKRRFQKLMLASKLAWHGSRRALFWMVFWTLLVRHRSMTDHTSSGVRMMRGWITRARLLQGSLIVLINFSKIFGTIDLHRRTLVFAGIAYAKRLSSHQEIRVQVSRPALYSKELEKVLKNYRMNLTSSKLPHRVILVAVPRT